MHSSVTILCLLLVNLCFGQEKNDSTEIVNLLREDYKTMVTHDIDKHKTFCSQDYLLIENGEIWNMDREAIDYNNNASRVIERSDYFNFRYVKVDGNTAYAVYGLKSDITEDGKLRTRHWNESTIFRKEGGVWKIALIHSTPIAVK